MATSSIDNMADAIAVIGMSGRWPQARDVDEFWSNIRDGKDCVSRFSPSELGVENAEQLVAKPNYVAARSVIDDPDLFDAEFFGILPKEAQRIDPQQRIFLEICWEALEDAGYDPHGFAGAIGLFAGSSFNSYFLRNVCRDRDFVESFVGEYPLGNFQEMLGALAESLTTRVSYKLNLKGPSFTIQTACSTSLVAVCQACQSLQAFQCDMALAGGVSVTFPQQRGYFYADGAMGSRDGFCRPFDADATGTVFGSGAGVVVLKRLADAVADGDHVYSVIRGFAVNNDGANKVGYTAPSVEGQAEVIATAQAFADVDPATISYLEAHGTGTSLGDPIEFEALVRAFGSQTDRKQFCTLGAIKSNVGHLEVAAGVSGLINATQALVHRQLPPLLHFQKPNPGINLDDSPFVINREAKPWERSDVPRRAGVSSFGVGGTNAHVVLEEAPTVELPQESGKPNVLVLSARTETALDQATQNLARHLRSHPSLSLDAVAYTLQVGRHAFAHRRILACQDLPTAIQSLEKVDSNLVATNECHDRPPSVVFMFPGQGSQYAQMGGNLNQTDEACRQDVDRCCDLLPAPLGSSIHELISRNPSATESAVSAPASTDVVQPALFIVEYAIAQHWLRLGIRPAAMIGHSIGEYVAACLANVFSLEDALAIVAERGRLMQSVDPGSMLSVRSDADDVVRRLNSDLTIAAVNSPQQCVVSGPTPSIQQFQEELEQQGVLSRVLATSHAFHSTMMDAILPPFMEFLSRFQLQTPQIPYISCVSGTWITDDDATSADYWARHLREPVQFSRGVRTLQQTSDQVYLEVGPGAVLCGLTAQHRTDSGPVRAIPSLPHLSKFPAESVAMCHAAGLLWLQGVNIEWSRMHGGGARRCSLPTYPFERRRHWIDPSRKTEDVNVSVGEDSNARNASMETMQPDQEATETQHQHSRVHRIVQQLLDMLNDLSGMQLSERDATESFLVLGFDSLFLTQVSQAIRGEFDLEITFRQLLSEFTTVEAIATHIDATLPPDPPPPSSVSESRDQSLDDTALADGDSSSLVASVPSAGDLAAASTSSQGLMERVVKQQLETMRDVMARQLAALGDSSAATSGPIENIDVAQTQDRLTANKQQSRAAAEAQPTCSEGPEVARPGTHEGDSSEPAGRFRPHRRAVHREMTEQQSQYLQDLIRRYTAKTAGSKASTQQNRRQLADPRACSGFRDVWKEIVYPLVTTTSEGCHIRDIDGNEYIDLVNGFGPIMLGHSPPFVTDAVREQLAQGFATGPQSPLAGEVAGLICELTGNERVTFCNTGSEAVMAAIRVARAVTGRERIIVFSGAYHGTFDEVLVRGAFAGAPPSALPIAPGIPRDMLSNVTVLEYGSERALGYIREHANELAAVLVEPVQSRHPALQPVEFLREVRQITAASGTALVFDEVVTGFRIHPGGAQAHFDIRADLVTYGKVLGGGLPIGVLSGHSKFMDALDGGHWGYGDDSFPEVGVTFFAGTFVRHPLALAAARAVLIHLKQEGPRLQQRLNEQAAELSTRINGYFQEFGIPSQVEHFGSVMYFAFSSDHPEGALLYYLLREKGIFVLEGFPCFLTTAHAPADIDRVAEAFREALVDLQSGGFFVDLHEPAGAGESTIGAPGVAATALPNTIPLTESQMEVWLAARQSDEANYSFNESFTLYMRGRLNTAALQAAIRQVVARHDALRSTFDPNENCVRIVDRLEIDIPLADLSDSSAVESKAEFDRLVAQDATTPFDLVNGPLVRVALIRLNADEHALVVTAHHLVCDGWSTNVLLSELGSVYSAECTGDSKSLATARPFREYALEQQRWRTSAEYQAIENWWVEKFKTPATLLDLPTDRPRPALKSYNGSSLRSTIDADLYKRIRRFGGERDCTPFVTLLAAFNILLCRFTSQEDIVVGLPAAGQSLLNGETLVGHCVNFLPLRSAVLADMEVDALLRDLREGVLDAYEHQQYTYGSLVRKLGGPRDPSRLPLVEVQFNLETVGKGLDFHGLSVSVDSNPKAAVNFDIFLNVTESENGLRLDCDYNSDLFDRATIERWLDHYHTLLEAMVAKPSQTINQLALLTAEQRRTLVVDWNSTRTEYPRDMCLHELVAAQATRSPDRIAVKFGDEAMTYADLEQRSNRLASILRKNGATRGELVGVCVDRSTEMLVSLLAVAKAGAAYVPLDPAYPDARLTAILEDARPIVMLSHSAIAHRWHASRTRMLLLDELELQLADESSVLTPSDVGPADLAYVIFTSGSTGKPKGVSISHGAVVNFLYAMKRCPGMSADDRLLAVTTFSFDIAVLELFLPLIVGGQVVIASSDAVRDGDKLRSILSSDEITIMQATPSTWRLLIEAGWQGTPGLRALCGGEALPRDLAESLLQRGASLWNMYGPTETTVWSSVLEVKSGDGGVPIGPPIDNTQFYVLDAQGEPTPIGIPGELYIGGDSVADGYWNNPQLTSNRFPRDPFVGNATARMYRTGDRVRYWPDGTLEFLGRLDNQVKIRGFRIELGEIELAIMDIPGLVDCVVVPHEFAADDHRLVGYIVSSESTAPTSGDVRRFLTTRLPDYMVPSMVVVLSSLPRLPNGKVDRRSLPSPTSPADVAATDFVEPRNEPEEQLARICAEVLKLDRVGVHSDLFDLGADSLHIFQILARATDAGLNVTLKQVLLERTVSAICESSAAFTGDEETPRPSLVAVSRDQFRVPATAETNSHEETPTS